MRLRISWFSLAVMLFAVHAHAQVIVSVPTDLTAPPQTNGVRLPIQVSDVTNLGVISADLTLTYDTELLDVIGVSLQGSIAQAGMSSHRADDATGEVSIAIIVSAPLAGAGVLAYVVCDVTAQTTGGTSNLVLAKAHLNSGLVPAQTSDGLLSITDTPVETPHIISLSLPDNLSFPPGTTHLAIPIHVSDLTGLGVVSVSMRLHYDSSVLAGTGASLTGTIAKGGLVFVQANDTTGSMSLSLVFANPAQPALTGSGVLAYAQFDVQTDTPNATTPLTMTHALFNDDAYATLIRDGQVTVNGGDRHQQHPITANASNDLAMFDLRVHFPAGALLHDGVLDVSIPYTTPDLLGGLADLERVYTLRFAGDGNATLAQPCTLTFHYQDVDIPSHQSEAALHLYRKQDGVWKFVGGIQDTGANTVTIELDHFSTYALLAGYGYGDVTGNGQISAYDAGLILQKAVNMIGELPPPEWPAFFSETADVSANGSVSSFDAGMILRKTVGLPPHPGYPEEMRFPIELTLSGAAPASSPIRAESLSLRTTSTRGWMRIGLSLANTDGIIALDLECSVPRSVEPSVSLAPLSSQTLSQIHADSGTLYVGLANPSGLPQSERLLTLQFRDRGRDTLQQVLEGIHVRLNDAPVPLDLVSVTDRKPNRYTQLYASYPNPCNPETWIPFALDSVAPVSIRIFDSQGHFVRELNLGIKAPGAYLTQDRAAHWDGRNAAGERVASGVYTYQLNTGNVTDVRKLVVTR